MELVAADVHPSPGGATPSKHATPPRMKYHPPRMTNPPPQNQGIPHEAPPLITSAAPPPAPA